MSIPHAHFSVEVVQRDLGKPVTDSLIKIDGCRDCLIRALTEAILTRPEIKQIIQLAVNNAAAREAAESVPNDKSNLN